jgi:hypothetical protein
MNYKKNLTAYKKSLSLSLMEGVAGERINNVQLCDDCDHKYYYFKAIWKYINNYL